MTEMLTTADVAEKLHVTPATVYRWAQSGTIPSTRIGRILRFRLEDIEALSSHGIALGTEDDKAEPPTPEVEGSEGQATQPDAEGRDLAELVLSALAEMVAERLHKNAA